VVHFEKNKRLSGARTVVVAVVIEPDSTLTFFKKTFRTVGFELNRFQVVFQTWRS
jgi:hypothetical protein